MLRKQKPENDRKSRKTYAAQCGTPCVNAGRDSTAIRSIMADLCHALLFVGLDQSRRCWKNRWKRKEEPTGARTKMFRDQAGENGSRSTKYKPHEILERLRLFQRG